MIKNSMHKEIYIDGVIFDNYTVPETLPAWSQICIHCTQKYNINIDCINKNIGHGTCGVKGCTNKANHYIDFIR